MCSLNEIFTLTETPTYEVSFVGPLHDTHVCLTFPLLYRTSIQPRESCFITYTQHIDQQSVDGYSWVLVTSCIDVVDGKLWLSPRHLELWGPARNFGSDIIRVNNFLRASAMLKHVLAIPILSVCLSVRPSVCPSVRHTLVLYQNGWTYCHAFFTTR